MSRYRTIEEANKYAVTLSAKSGHAYVFLTPSTSVPPLPFRVGMEAAIGPGEKLLESFTNGIRDGRMTSAAEGARRAQRQAQFAKKRAEVPAEAAVAVPAAEAPVPKSEEAAPGSE